MPTVSEEISDAVWWSSQAAGQPFGPRVDDGRDAAPPAVALPVHRRLRPLPRAPLEDQDGRVAGSLPGLL